MTTLNTRLVPSTTVTSATLSIGSASSSLIVPITDEVPSVAFVGELSFTVNVSSSSLRVSSTVSTENDCEGVPGRNVSDDPDAGTVKFVPATAVSPDSELAVY